jgi:2-phospho-L-lactate guanylyltransferase
MKRLTDAKTRLRGARPGVAHEDLVLAIGLDTVTAALASAAVTRVVVVTSDRPVAAAVSKLGAAVVPDGPDLGLNPALRFGAAGLTGGVVALVADLPALRSAELTAALGRVPPAGRGFVPDAFGDGTVLLAAARATDLSPAFGTASAAQHAEGGAVRLDGPWPTLRRDVDTAADLAEAAGLGLGPHTAALLA